MKIIEPGYEIMTKIDRAEFLGQIELAGRTCYKSENLITSESAAKFVRMLINRGHEAMIEHAPAISVKFICDRGVSHEIVRHRIAGFAQESTRYCNYAKAKFGSEITVIKPFFWEEDSENYKTWESACKQAETAYFELLENGATPEQARAVLPNSLKTEIIMTANVREWRHFFKLRTSPEAHPQIRQLAVPLLEEIQVLLPEVFDDVPRGTF